jgi:hypothetical protein
MQSISICLIIAFLAAATSLFVRMSVGKKLKDSRLYLKYENLDDYIRRTRPDLYRIFKFSDYALVICFLLFLISLAKHILKG